MIADCQTEIHAARALVLETARKRDDGLDVTMEASICKYFASEMCGRVADRCVQMLGGDGFIADNSIERFYRDVRLFRLYEGTSQIHQLNIARRTFGRRATIFGLTRRPPAPHTQASHLREDKQPCTGEKCIVATCSQRPLFAARHRRPCPRTGQLPEQADQARRRLRARRLGRHRGSAGGREARRWN